MTPGSHILASFGTFLSCSGNNRGTSYEPANLLPSSGRLCCRSVPGSFLLGRERTEARRSRENATVVGTLRWHYMGVGCHFGHSRTNNWNSQPVSMGIHTLLASGSKLVLDTQTVPLALSLADHSYRSYVLRPLREDGFALTRAHLGYHETQSNTLRAKAFADHHCRATCATLTNYLEGSQE